MKYIYGVAMHTKYNSVNLLLKIKWFELKLPVLFFVYTLTHFNWTAGPIYLNVVPWLKKVPADTLTLIILKLLYLFTFKNINIFKRPIYANL